MGAPSGGSAKPGPLGPDSLFLFFSNSLPPAQQPTEHAKSKIMNFCESSLFETIGNLSAIISGQPLCDSSSDLMDVQDSYPIF